MPDSKSGETPRLGERWGDLSKRRAAASQATRVGPFAHDLDLPPSVRNKKLKRIFPRPLDVRWTSVGRPL